MVKTSFYIKTALFLMCASASLMAGLLPSGEWMAMAFEHSGYYITMVCLLGLLVMAVKNARGLVHQLIRDHWKALGLSVLATGYVFLLSPPQFKILADEANLVGTSMVMHTERLAALPIQSLPVAEDGFEFDCVQDKRPLIYPLLISMVHDMTGYRAENGFVVNFVASVMILFLFYRFVLNFVSKTSAYLSILVAVSLPVYVFWITSSGFEAVNLLFLIVAFAALRHFFQKREPASAEMVLFSVVVLAQCRYESVVFLGLLAFIVPVAVKRSFASQWTWMAPFAPLLLLPIFWQRRLFMDVIEPVRITLQGVETSPQAFSIDAIIPNLSNNLGVLTGVNPHYGFTPVVFLLAVIGCLLILRDIRTGANRMTDPAKQLTVAVGLLSAMVLMGIVSLYYWGDFSQGASNRFGFVLVPFIVFAACYCLDTLMRISRLAKMPVVAILVVVHVVAYAPFARYQKLVSELALTYEYKAVSEFINDRKDGISPLLVISDRPNLYTILGGGSVFFAFANEKPERLSSAGGLGAKQIFVIQRCLRGTAVPVQGNTLDDTFKMTELKRIPVNREYEMKISSLKV